MRYGKENVLILKVPHIRIYDGETDRLLVRTRTDKVEHDVVQMFEDGIAPEPNWFLERWLEEPKCLIVVVVYDNPNGVEMFREKHAEFNLDYIWDGNEAEAIKDVEVAKLNEEWEKAHAKTMEETEKVLDGNKDAVGRTLILKVNVEPKSDDETVEVAARRKFETIAKSIQEQLGLKADEALTFRYATILATKRKAMFMAMCFKTDVECFEFMEKISTPGNSELGYAKSTMDFAVERGDGDEIIEALKQITAAVVKEAPAAAEK